MSNEKFTPIEALAGMTVTGIMIGLGQILGSEPKLSVRLVIGRASTTTGLALIAGLGLHKFPDMDLLPLIGLSAAISSLGTSFLERLVQKFFGLGMSDGGK